MIISEASVTILTDLKTMASRKEVDAHSEGSGKDDQARNIRMLRIERLDDKSAAEKPLCVNNVDNHHNQSGPE